MAFPSAEETFDVREVLFFLLGKGVDTCSRGILASTLSSSTTAPRTSLVVLVLFVGLALVGGRLLLPTRYVSRGGISGFILPGVLILLLRWSVTSETLGINLPRAGG